jgi:hypothetical protein
MIMHIRSKSKTTREICASLTTGTHCIDATNLTKEQIRKYADSASTAIIDRKLSDGSPGMVARALHQVFEPQEAKNHEYKLIDATALNTQDLPPATRPSIYIAPEEARFKAKWFSQYEMPAGALDAKSNAFGGFGTVQMESSTGTLPIPVPVIDAFSAPVKFLAAYGVKLAHLTESTKIDFGNCKDLMAFRYDIYLGYFDNYIKTPKGGGVYLEAHDDFPHLAIPLHPSCGGSYAVARPIGVNEYAIVSFKIRYGWGLVIAPGAIHDDATLVGPYVIGLTINVDPKHVIFRKIIRSSSSLRCCAESL